MSVDKDPGIFSCQMEAIVYIFSRKMEATVYLDLDKMLCMFSILHY